MKRDFVVYEHWRPDTLTCFYVGKGKLKRARSFESRNSRYGRIVNKLLRMGMSPTVKIVASGMSEDAAFFLERSQIAYWRGRGIKTANFTDGGDGASGRVHSQDAIAKIRQRATGRRASAETRHRMAVARIGRRHSEETKAKISAAAKIAQKSRAERERAELGEAEIRRRMKVLAQLPRCVPRPVVKGFT